jgi:hypothetical protein
MYNPALGHEEVVASVRRRFPKAMLSAEECVRVCAEVARTLIEMGEVDAGLLNKTSGNKGCFEDCYSVDIICYAETGRIFDCLIDGGYNDGGTSAPGKATATWGEAHGSPVPIDRWRAPVDSIPPPEDAPTPIPPQPVPEPVFQCPQWVPTNLQQAHEEARYWRDLYMNAAHNPQHLEPSITDLQLWDWRRWVELWDPLDIEAEIKNPGSTTGKNTFCRVLPPK